MPVLECIACRRPIEPGEPMVIVITALPDRLTRIPLQRHVDAAPGRWHWRCAPRRVRRYAAPITLYDPLDSVDWSCAGVHSYWATETAALARPALTPTTTARLVR